MIYPQDYSGGIILIVKDWKLSKCPVVEFWLNKNHGTS